MAKKRKKRKASLKVLQKKSTKLIRQEYLDYDYIDKLNDKELQWLADFTDEHYNASVGRQKDNGKNNRFYKSKKLVKESQTRNNKNNNDVFSKARAKNDIVYTHSEGVFDPQLRTKKFKTDAIEDALIEALDAIYNPDETTDDSNEDSGNS